MTFDAAAPRILVVEDDPLVLDMVLDLIDSFGYAAVGATDGMEAIRIIADSPSLALVFTYITMPGLDGLMLADMVKQHRPALKILYTTGGAKVPRVRAEAGILHGNILEKPYRPEDLRRELEQSFANNSV
jgi:CheY-like chemotaxis protein